MIDENFKNTVERLIESTEDKATKDALNATKSILSYPRGRHRVPRGSFRTLKKLADTLSREGNIQDAVVVSDAADLIQLYNSGAISRYKS